MLLVGPGSGDRAITFLSIDPRWPQPRRARRETGRHRSIIDGKAAGGEAVPPIMIGERHTSSLVSHATSPLADTKIQPEDVRAAPYRP